MYMHTEADTPTYVQVARDAVETSDVRIKVIFAYPHTHAHARASHIYKYTHAHM